jgi:UDP-2,3-diacylglucosamine pyrophosphatase LpxH
MSAGIYMNNGVLAYSMNLEKKLKRRKQAVIIEEYKGDLTGDLLEQQLQIMLNKHLNITKTEKTETEDKPLKYHWRNKITGHTHHSIYPHMNNIPNINKDEWEPYEES